ncbi:MAG: NAD+ synthase [Candidatus Omnitrophica bacterium]|nr:NAD+ synthase [Candidatus Omnitrophota bacterium]
MAVVNPTLRIALVQPNLTVGDLHGNAERVLEGLARAQAVAADLTVFPELTLSGYPPEDLLLKPQFRKDNARTLRQLAPYVPHGMTALIGFVDEDKKGHVYNALAVIAGGVIRGVYHKMCLPNYGVFDERRYFTPGKTVGVLALGELLIALSICEDIWRENGPLDHDRGIAGAQIIVNASASPYHAGKRREREDLLKHRARQHRAAICYVNLVGGQDELIFDGSSQIWSSAGRKLAQVHAFEEDLLVHDLEIRPQANRRAGGSNRSGIRLIRCPKPQNEARPKLGRRKRVPELSRCEEIYKALVLGTRDYVRKNRFKAVCLGLSGGIDSALTAAIAADALGADQVNAVVMPSPFSSKGTMHDAEALAKNLGIGLLRFPIESLMKEYEQSLTSTIGHDYSALARENVQARIRGNLLMALSNSYGWLLLTTGNKSEMATGYCTLYGDMAGGFAVLKDVPKTLVYELSEYRNSVGCVIPRTVLTRAPSAELAKGQKDADSLPPYEVLDPIIKGYVEEDRSYSDLVRAGHRADAVRRTIRLVDGSEYKRRQGPPGVRITPRAFGKDRRIPITNRYAQF